MNDFFVMADVPSGRYIGFTPKIPRGRAVSNSVCNKKGHLNTILVLTVPARKFFVRLKLIYFK